jgi:polyphosphate glucokinase
VARSRLRRDRTAVRRPAADYVVIGGGNVEKLDRLPPNARRGDNENAFKGGFRLWQDNALVI